MLAMQYRFVLPADYDMTIIQRRIADNGKKMDGFPCLLFKAFLYAWQKGADMNGQENSYAPFYLWQDADSMHRFLASEGFKRLTPAFGWPRIDTFPVLSADISTAISQASWAVCEISPVQPYSDLALLTHHRPLDNALVRVSALDACGWRRLTFTLWRTPQAVTCPARAYQVGYIARA